LEIVSAKIKLAMNVAIALGPLTLQDTAYALYIKTTIQIIIRKVIIMAMTKIDASIKLLTFHKLKERTYNGR